MSVNTWQPANGALVAFDHGDALFCREGRFRLQSGEYVGGELDPHLTGSDDLEHWSERIAVVPRALIAEICQEPVRRCMVDTDDAEAAVNFLDTRKTRIVEILRHSDACRNVAWR